MLTDIDIQALIDDLSTFALTGSAIGSTRVDGDTVTFRWTQGKSERIRDIRKSADTIEVRLQDEWVPYRAFLASEEMADLAFLAKRILDRVPRQDPYYPVKLIVDDGGQPSNPSEAVATLRAEAVGRASSIKRTEVLFVRGEAGGGKSVVLRTLALQQAEAF